MTASSTVEPGSTAPLGPLDPAGQRFADLVYADPDLLRAEFDQLIATGWPGPVPPGPPAAGPPEPGPATYLPAARADRPHPIGDRHTGPRTGGRSPPAPGDAPADPATGRR